MTLFVWNLYPNQDLNTNKKCLTSQQVFPSTFVRQNGISYIDAADFNSPLSESGNRVKTRKRCWSRSKNCHDVELRSCWDKSISFFFSFDLLWYHFDIALNLKKWYIRLNVKVKPQAKPIHAREWHTKWKKKTQTIISQNVTSIRFYLNRVEFQWRVSIVIHFFSLLSTLLFHAENSIIFRE